MCYFCKMQNNKRQITGYLLAILFVFYFAGANFFSHSHIDEYNRLIVHSHPFSSESNHQHSTANFLAIDRLLNFTVCLLFFGISFVAINKLSLVLSDPYNRRFQGSAFTPVCFSRPPPVI